MTRLLKGLDLRFHFRSRESAREQVTAQPSLVLQEISYFDPFPCHLRGLLSQLMHHPAAATLFPGKIVQGPCALPALP